jgi:hypothetical protein
MRKLLMWLGLAGAVLFTIVLALFLVRAPFDPARMIKRKLFPNSNMVYEARVQLTLARELSQNEMDKFLAEENLLLDSDDFLAPLVKELGLAAQWKLDDEAAAVTRLRDSCELRRGELPMTMILAARDKKEPDAGRLIQAVSKSYMARKQPALPPSGGEGFNGGF